MKRVFNPQLTLILLFLAIIGSVAFIQLVVEAARGERPQALDIFKRRPTASHLRAYERNLEDASWVAAKLRPWAQYVQFAWLGDGGPKAMVGRDGWLFYGPGVEYSTERLSVHEGNSSANDAVAAVIDFRNQLAGRGIHLLVMPVPDKESVYPEKFTWRATRSPGFSPDTVALLGQLKAAQVEVVDLFKLFTTCKDNASGSVPFYLVQDSHWSPAGVALASHATARRLLEQGWVKTGDVGYESRPKPTRRVGDILRMLQVPQLESEAAAEIAPCRQVLRADSGKLYQDDASSEVLVLGDSFLRIYQTDEPGAGGFIAHLARELGRPVASIVNDGGASTLVRQELNRRPALLAHKKVVIWEFVERDIRLGTEGWQRVPLPPAMVAKATVVAPGLEQ